MIDMDALLQKTSRTFALAIPLLPEPTRREVSVAYLLFRIADTFEDATLWPASRRIETLNRFIQLLDDEPDQAAGLAAECAREPPLSHAGYQELLSQAPQVLGELAKCSPGARASIRRHVGHSAAGMIEFVRRADGRGNLVLGSIADLRGYCYAVAGIVGEMLTELYLLDRPALAPVAVDLADRAAEFGEGLQLVNILKDAQGDAAEGRVYLPRAVPAEEIFQLAGRDLERAGEFVDLLRRSGAPRGLVAFNGFIGGLATANLHILAERGPGAKLSRAEVAQIGARVIEELDDSNEDDDPDEDAITKPAISLPI
ncbi:MAG TPA: squalene/phytoene synthase family protein [Polyangia bacterium]|nr:squalene/phytoene synthase family protein [Polyangia bacterium]